MVYIEATGTKFGNFLRENPGRLKVKSTIAIMFI